MGLSHRTAPVDLLERAALTSDAVTKLLADLLASDHATEAMVLSTCNRVEVYAEVDKFHGGLAQASELLARRAGVDLDELTPHLYVHYEDRAVSHLFSVACGLDSMVVGESQVLGQVRVGLRTAQDAGSAGRQLGALASRPSGSESGPAPRPASTGPAARWSAPAWRWPAGSSARWTAPRCSSSEPAP